MKEQAIQYLAMDVHQATIVACVRDDRGAITMRATVPTEARAILSLVRGAGTRVHVAFEEGTQAQWLHDLLAPHVERVVVCNVRGKSEVSNNSDCIDAEQLCELLRVGTLRTVYHGSSSVLTLKELVRNRAGASALGDRSRASAEPPREHLTAAAIHCRRCFFPA